MADLATAVNALPARESSVERPSRRSSRRAGIVIFLLAVLAGFAYVSVHVAEDLQRVTITSAWPLVMLGLALAVALGFEFVNGFHDTANAVATVIYTHSLQPHTAVVWSGLCNLAGVLFSSGAVAYAIVALLPVEMILKISSGSGFAMVFALLIAAILWNLGTWWLGLPASSSHTLVGSIMGVGLASQLIEHSGASGLDWAEVIKVLKALFISPIVGFVLAGALILISKRLLKHPSLYEAPKDNQPPSWPIRALMVVTCTGVSFFHGSNDGQKGMGLIMLILIGTIPTAFALNHAVSPADMQTFLVSSAQTSHILESHIAPGTADPDAHMVVTNYVRTHRLQPETVLGVRQLVNELGGELSEYKSFAAVPAHNRVTLRNDMYLTSQSLALMAAGHKLGLTPAESAELKSYRSQLDRNTNFIPTWVKVAVALALGLGTMVGWKRIVVTVGERIGKEHMTYAQGASAGLVTMATIFAADSFGLPVSTTHILSSGVAGTMSANGSGLRWSTVRNIAAGWMLTLPAAALLSGTLYVLFRWIG